MTREDLVSLCDDYVRHREVTEAAAGVPADPSPEILRSFRLAEISESEMEALLAYVGDPDDEGCLAAEALAWIDEPPAEGGDATDGFPRHPR